MEFISVFAHLNVDLREFGLNKTGDNNVSEAQIRQIIQKEIF